ncbi:hypothetical protein BRADI_2g37801v3 [Brachypodium distachyon]|uniref:Uncharacterized protein n=1 Tax=Brachypodium distachyon TaxID=15368 RepID=A0A2K2DCF3_BRADI|nr:hypothetical protein BRADI_2g37801v3 [Brachypodium distachyon]
MHRQPYARTTSCHRSQQITSGLDSGKLSLDLLIEEQLALVVQNRSGGRKRWRKWLDCGTGENISNNLQFDCAEWF